MTTDELLAALSDKKALIVHFSGYHDPGNGAVFPNDLKHAIATHMTEVRSCEILWPSYRHQTWGDVGVVFEPVDIGNVLSVKEHDSGAANFNGVESSGGDPLTFECLEATFRAAEEHNEWRVKGASVKGIFIRLLPVAQVNAYQDIVGPCGESEKIIGMRQIDVPELRAIFRLGCLDYDT
ncbi:MAG: hypothetical protein ACLQME_21110 [Alphaproteobacteria bacterium]